MHSCGYSHSIVRISVNATAPEDSRNPSRAASNVGDDGPNPHHVGYRIRNETNITITTAVRNLKLLMSSIQPPLDLMSTLYQVSYLITNLALRSRGESLAVVVPRCLLEACRFSPFR